MFGLGNQNQQHHDAAAPAAAPASADPALLANVHSPAELAAVLRTHHAQSDALLHLAHQRFGNGFVSEALPLVALTDAQARTAAPGQLDTSALRNADDDSPGHEVINYDPTSRLPFTAAGWDARAILSKVGQRDRIANTDSDGVRCVQAVGIASHVLRGPDAVVQYLDYMLGDAAHGATAPSPRQVSGRAVLARVCDRLRTRSATFEDLYWAQEALHDLTVANAQGTPDPQAVREIAPNATSTTRTLSQWCKTPQDVIAAAAGLAEGEQFVAMQWEIAFNAELTYQNAEHNFHSSSINVTDDATGQASDVQRAQLPRHGRPDPAIAINGRDTFHGHQLLITRQQGELRLYEPEHSPTGHFLPLNAASLAHIFTDKPRDSMYGYMRLEARITPR